MDNPIYLKMFELSDAEALLQLELRNRAFLHPFANAQDEAFYTLDGQRKRLESMEERRSLDQYYAYGIYRTETAELIGNVALAQIKRGPLQRCIIGYYLDQAHNGKGYMTHAVRQAVSIAFEVLKLHRIEAGVMPSNVGSIKVLEKAGFQCEGLSKKNFRMNGKWEDHFLYAMVNEND